ncbi:MAG: hypothetical protein AAF626_16375 [Pseudomonadota bacterium]
MAEATKILSVYKGLIEKYFADDVKGKKLPYTAMNGNMYSFVDAEGHICLRMAEPERARFSRLFGTDSVKQYGAVIKGYVAIPNAFLEAPDHVEAAFAASLAHARTLKAK